MTMGTQTELGYAKIENFTKPQILGRKVALITPRMDVDVTGVSIKNVRTHVIDYPKDEGLKQREQLWNFQQKYRGAPAAKLKPVSNPQNKGIVVHGFKTNSPCEMLLGDESSNEAQRVQRTVSGEALSLQPPFRKSFSHRLRVTMRPGGADGYTLYDTPKSNSNAITTDIIGLDEKLFEKTRPGLQKQYSSGLIVKNSLYNRLLASDCGDQKPVTLEESRLLRQAIEKYGSLERLPSIGYTNQNTEYTQSQMLGNSLRAMNPYVQFGRRLGVQQQPDRRITPLRRSVTNIDTPRRKKEQNDPTSRLSCNDSDEEDGVIDDEEEYAKETQIARTQKLHQREPKRVINVNIPTFNTQDDMALLDPHALAKRARQYSNGIAVSVITPDNTARNNLTTSERLAQDAIVSSDAACYLYSSDDSDLSDVENSKANTTKRNKNRKYTKRTSDKKSGSDSSESEERPSSGDSLDIPRERFGPTTHSIDRKLAIRKPWDWRPNLYRWTDKTLRETDKPYIQKVINSGELVDEYNYDSFARTKPLKLQNYPDQCQPFKDRNGVLR